MKDWSREKWLDAYSTHGTVIAACKVVGISRDTAYRIRKLEPEFADAWVREEQAVNVLLEQTLVEVATDFSHRGQVKALEIALKSRLPTKYRETVKLEHGGTINHELVASVARENRELEEQLGVAGDAAASGDPSPRALASGN